MAFEDSVIGGGSDFDPKAATESLIRDLTPDLPPGSSLDPRMLNTNLGRKLAMGREQQAKAPEQLDYSQFEPAKPDVDPKALDYSDFAPVDISTTDLGTGMGTAGYGTSKAPPEVGPVGNAVTGAVKAAIGTMMPEGNELAVNPIDPATIPNKAGVIPRGIGAGAVNTVGGLASGLGTLNKTMNGDKSADPNVLQRAGAAIKSIAPQLTDEESASITGRVAQGAGGLLPYLATAPAGLLAGLGATGVGMALDAYGSVFAEAKKHGATDESAAQDAAQSALVTGVLGSLPLSVGKFIKPLVGKIFASGAVFTGVGELQEALLQQIAKDYDPKAGYNPDAKRAIASFILGAGMGIFHHAFEKKPGEPPPPKPDDIRPDDIKPDDLPPPDDIRPDDVKPDDVNPKKRRDRKPPPDDKADNTDDVPPGPGPGPGNPGTGKPPPGTGEGKGADFTMDASTRAKMERVYRHFEPGADPSKMADHELYNAVNEHLRDTSSTGHTAKPETPEEAAAREGAAQRRSEDAELKGAFAWMTDAQLAAMTPKMRKVWLGRARGAKPNGPTTGTETPKAPPEQAAPEAPTSESDVALAGTRAAPIKAVTADDVVKAQPAEPTPAQAQADNYKQAHVELPHLGLTGKNSISIETGVGGERKGVDANGQPWSVTMEHGAYGKIKGSQGADGDHLDIFVGPHPTSPHVFVLNQIDPATGKWDEHKVLAGYRTPIDAMHAYANSFTDKAEGRIGGMVAMTPDQFKNWLKNGDHSKPVGHADGRQASWTERNPRVWDLEKHQKTVQQPQGNEIQKLRGPGNQDVSGMGGKFPDVSGGRGSQAESRTDVGSQGQQSGIRTGERALDDVARTERESEGSQSNRAQGGVSPNGTGVEGVGPLSELSKKENEASNGSEKLERKPASSTHKGEEAGVSSTEVATRASGATPKETPPGTATGAGRSESIMHGTRHSSEQNRPPAKIKSSEKPADRTDKSKTASPKPLPHRVMNDERDPVNLLQFIVDRGGLKSHPDLKAMDAHRKIVRMWPGYKGGIPKLVNNKTGHNLDYMARLAQDAGYFPSEKEGQLRTLTPDDLLKAIKEGLAERHIYAQHEFGMTPKRERVAADEREQHEKLRDEEAYGEARKAISEDYGDLDPSHRDLAARLMVDHGMDVDTAVDNAAIQQANELGASPEQIDDIIGTGGFDAIAQPKPVSEVGRPDARDVEKGNRPGEGEKAGRGSADVQDTGAQGGKEPAKPDTTERPAAGGRRAAGNEAGDTAKNQPATAVADDANLIDENDPRLSPNEIEAINFALKDKEHKIHPKSPMGITLRKILDRGETVDAQEVDILESALGMHHRAMERRKKAEPTVAKRKSFDDMTEADKKAARDAPTWAEILHQLPMHKDGRTREHEIAFGIMKDRWNKTKYDDLTPEQKHELLKAVTPEPTFDKQSFVDGAVRQSPTVEGISASVQKAVDRGASDVDLIDALTGDGSFGGRSIDRGSVEHRGKVLTITGPFGKVELKGKELADAIRRAFPKTPEPTTERGADNKDQLVIPGAEKESQGTQAQRKADQPLKPKVAQKPADAGLFGDEKDQADLLDMAKKPAAPKDMFDDIFDRAMDEQFADKPAMGIDDVAKGLKGLFSESEPAFESFDEDKYRKSVPFFQAGMAHFKGAGVDLPTMVRSLIKHLSGAGMTQDAIRAMKPYIRRFTEDVVSGKESIDAPSSGKVLEPNSGKPTTGNGVGKADVPAAAGPARPSTGKRGKPANAGDQRPAASGSLPQDHAPVVGADGNLELPARQPESASGDATPGERERGADHGEEGLSPERTADEQTIRNAQADADLGARRESQRKAEGTPVKPGDIGNIADTLPMLFPEQHQDVLKAEQRYAKPDGHGMLFTNGTGTGKTYSGLGVIKRMAMQGKNNILVLAPSQPILTDWVKSARDFGLDINVLADTMDKGHGLTATTYANLGANRHLADREWDLVVADEAHKLSSDQNGTATEALKTFRALTMHPDGLNDRGYMMLRDEADAQSAMPDGPAKYAAFLKLNDKVQALVEKWRTEPRPKALMMSATPFAYHFSLDYAEGYLFNYDRNKDGGRYNSGDGRDAFFMQHLGYRMRTNKLTKPDADVRQEVMERQLHEYLKKQGSLSGRALEVDKDYDRKFVLAHDAVGQLIDKAMTFLQEAEDGRYRPIYDIISKKFDYLTRMRLLEAMKAQSAIPYIKKSLDLGRKVVVFHDYNEGGGISPFDLTLDPNATTTIYQNGEHVEVKPAELYADFVRQNPYIEHMDFSKYPAPIHALTAAFPKALVYNGTISNKLRNEAKRLFNDDNSGHDIIIVQSAAGEAGISLHDTTGKKQRTLVNLGMPIRPTTSIQQEGRIYRVGQASDAIFRYMNTGTDWERWTFAGKIAERAGTAENLALGDQARTIRQSFVDSFSNADDYQPERGEGKGGKEADRAISHSVSEFEKAKTHYFANAKTGGRRDQREGTDYYATPEPIGLKMVEFAGLKPGEKILEPSAGHGAISRYFPEDSARTLVEPSTSLASRAALTSPGARVVVDRFENLDPGANKFDAIVMNPPFGVGGKTAIEHLAKAAKHIKNGGRIVALIPQGGMADKRFDDFMEGEAGKNLYPVGNIKLPPVTFEHAGTSASTRIVVLEKQIDPHIAVQLQEKQRDYSDIEKIGDLFDRIENADMGQRLQPATKEADIPTEGMVKVNGIEFNLKTNDYGKTPVAQLKTFIKDRFRSVAKAAEDAGGEWVPSRKEFTFPSAEARANFLEGVANPPPEAEKPNGITFKTGETIHAKTGGKLFVASPEQRVERDAYNGMKALAGDNGGYWSSFKLNGAIPGFQFKSAADRQKFLDAMAGKPNGLAEDGLSQSPDRFEHGLPRVNYAVPASSGAGATGQSYVLQHGRRTGNEHLLAYDANGKEVERSEGTRNQVKFSPEFNKLLHDPTADIVAHHNHPNGTSLSQQDISMLGASGMRAVWAHGHNGNIYRGELNPEYKNSLPADSTQRYWATWNLIQRIDAKLRKVIQAAIYAHEVPIKEAENIFSHLLNAVLRDAHILDYQTNFDAGDFISRVPGLDETMRSAAITARLEAFHGDPRNDTLNRRTQPVRHPGDVGAVFDRGAVATPVSGKDSAYPTRPTDNQREAPRVDRGVGGEQPRLLEHAGLSSTLGAFGDPAKVAAAFKSFWTSNFQPELVSDKALLADPLFAKYKSSQAQEKDALIRQSESEWNYWNKRGDAERIRFLDDVETAVFGSVPADPRQAAMARRYRAMLDENWRLEKQFGSQAAFVEDYFPHIWEKPDAWRAFSAARSAQMGPTWFQKKRSIDYITDGLAAGLKLKYTNPVDIIVHRLSSGVDMRQRMQLLYDLKDQGLAWEGVQGGPQLVKRGWIMINAPDRKQWVIAPDAQLLWKNGLEAKGLWQAEHVGGSMFRGWMALKNAWIPVKLAMSAFHPLHVLHINYSNGMAQGWDDLVKGRAPISALKAVANGFVGPLIAAPGATTGTIVGGLLGSTVGMPVWGGIVGSMAGAATFGAGKRMGIMKDLPHRGKQAREAWSKRPQNQTPQQKADVALMEDGGFVPQLSEQMKIGAKRNLAVAWQKLLRKEAGPGDWLRVVSSSMRRSVEVLQAPIFEQWIPSLKTAAYLQQAAALLKRRPELLTYHNDRRVALRAIAKSIDNRFGEMFYGNLFWNRYLKDSAIGSFLSIGWNLGFVREFGGAAMEAVTRPAGLIPPFKPGASRRVIREASNKIAFNIAYMGSSALILGMISMLMDDEHRPPEGLDWIFPRIGGVNPDGSPRRTSNMSYIREVPMLMKHIQEKGGNVLTGTAEMIYNKMLFEPFNELINNRSYYGYNVWDENAPVYKQVWQAIKHTFGNETSPMAISGAKHAAALSGKEFPSASEAIEHPDKLLDALRAKGVDMSFLGFGPAPAYVEKSAIQNRISALYGRHVAPASKPQADEENSQEKLAVRTAIMIAKRDNDPNMLAAARERGKAIGLTPKYMSDLGKTPTDVYLFSRLPVDDQRSLLRDASKEEVERYLPHASKKLRFEINNGASGQRYDSAESRL